MENERIQKNKSTPSMKTSEKNHSSVCNKNTENNLEPLDIHTVRNDKSVISGTLSAGNKSEKTIENRPLIERISTKESKINYDEMIPTRIIDIKGKNINNKQVKDEKIDYNGKVNFKTTNLTYKSHLSKPGNVCFNNFGKSDLNEKSVKNISMPKNKNIELDSKGIYTNHYTNSFKKSLLDKKIATRVINNLDNIAEIIMIDDGFEILSMPKNIEQNQADNLIINSGDSYVIKINKFNLLHPKNIESYKNLHINHDESGYIHISGIFIVAVRQNSQKRCMKNENLFYKSYSKNFIQSYENSRNKSSNNHKKFTPSNIYYNTYFIGVSRKNFNEDKFLNIIGEIIEDMARIEADKIQSLTKLMNKIVCINNQRNYEEDDNSDKILKDTNLNNGTKKPCRDFIFNNSNEKIFKDKNGQNKIGEKNVKVEFFERMSNSKTINDDSSQECIFNKELDRNFFKETTNEAISDINPKEVNIYNNEMFLDNKKNNEYLLNNENYSKKPCETVIPLSKEKSYNSQKNNSKYINNNNENIHISKDNSTTELFKNVNYQSCDNINQTDMLKKKIIDEKNDHIETSCRIYENNHDTNNNKTVKEQRVSFETEKENQTSYTQKTNMKIKNKLYEIFGDANEEFKDVKISSDISKNEFSKNTEIMHIQDNNVSMNNHEEAYMEISTNKQIKKISPITLLNANTPSEEATDFLKNYKNPLNPYKVFESEFYSKKKISETPDCHKFLIFDSDFEDPTDRKLEYDEVYYDDLNPFQKKELAIFCSKILKKNDGSNIFKRTWRFIKEVFYEEKDEKYYVEKKINPIIYEIGSKIKKIGSNAAGTFRINGKQHYFHDVPIKIQNLDEFDLSGIEIEDLSSIFKGYLNNVLNGIFPKSTLKTIFNSKDTDISDNKGLYKAMTTCIPFCMPENERILLMYIMSIWHEIIVSSQSQTLDAKGCAVCFAPSMVNDCEMKSISDIFGTVNCLTLIYNDMELKKIDKNLFSKFVKHYNIREYKRKEKEPYKTKS